MKATWILYAACLLGAVQMLSVSSASSQRQFSVISTANLSVPMEDIADAANTNPHSVSLDEQYLYEPLTRTIELNCNKSSNDTETVPLYVGFIVTGVAVIFYGSSFVPVKKFETGDGMFFQWVLGAGIWLTGLILQMVRPATFYPIVMLGGAIWATGNVCVVPIIKTIGMGLGMCIWGMLALLSGWAVGRFGFGLTCPEVPTKEAMNYVGVFLAAASSIIYALIKSEVGPAEMELVIQTDDSTEPLLEHSRTDLYGANPQQDVLVFNKRRSRTSSLTNSLSEANTSGQSAIDRLSKGQKRIVGLGLSVFSGLLYGINFTPAIYIQDNYSDASQNGLDFVFAHYCGIFLTGSVYFFIYCAFKKNKPVIFPKAILPAILSGMMWAVATGCWFIANKALSEPVSFPIIATVPGGIASLFWGVFIFKEIRGKRNIGILLVAFSVTTAGAILAGVSKS